MPHKTGRIQLPSTQVPRHSGRVQAMIHGKPLLGPVPPWQGSPFSPTLPGSCASQWNADRWAKSPREGTREARLKSKVLLGLCEADCGSFSSFLLGRQAAYQFLEKQNTVVAQGHSCSVTHPKQALLTHIAPPPLDALALLSGPTVGSGTPGELYATLPAWVAAAMQANIAKL